MDEYINKLRELLPKYEITVPYYDHNKYDIKYLNITYCVGKHKILTTLDKIVEMHDSIDIITGVVNSNGYESLRSCNIYANLYDYSIIHSYKIKKYTPDELIIYLRELFDLESLNKPLQIYY